MVVEIYLTRHLDIFSYSLLLILLQLKRKIVFVEYMHIYCLGGVRGPLVPFGYVIGYTVTT